MSLTADVFYEKCFLLTYLVVETIEKRREPLPTMECIYLITPSEKSVKALMMDFQSQNRTQYRAAHIYFTEGIYKIAEVPNYSSLYRKKLHLANK